jgi:ArsR family transcriptional regulator, arsenate/arsenite/antimonite-responsive transcriptional repressor
VTATLEAIECCVPLHAEVLSDDEAEATASLFKALADPARVRIVNVLATSGGEPVCICHLIEPLGLSQPTVSHHMKRLLDAGLVEREQRSKWAYFSLKPDAVEKLALVADLKGVCC